MAEEKDPPVCTYKGKTVIHRHGASSAVYGLGFIGAVIYFLQHAATFWIGVIGIGKAIFWPAILIYKVLGLLKM